MFKKPYIPDFNENHQKGNRMPVGVFSSVSYVIVSPAGFNPNQRANMKAVLEDDENFGSDFYPGNDAEG